MLSLFRYNILFLSCLGLLATIQNKFGACWDLVPEIWIKRGMKLIRSCRQILDRYIFITVIPHVLHESKFIQYLACILGSTLILGLILWSLSSAIVS